MRQILRDEWGFDGFVVSDAFAVGNMVIQGHARDGREAALRASKPGLTWTCPATPTPTMSLNWWQRAP
ncbi:glycoside hydrolase family 3 N-terminal domain-containing protein [Candidatus Amarolinea dominans]|uniref:glycoside hydrolase family 3 N-terminal domain-containing protein n=1 Tax=Candidatus Amarolinea dominans TaxID=3140696 RepID=UPI0031CC40E0